jgi:hypothetical protein
MGFGIRFGIRLGIRFGIGFDGGLIKVEPPSIKRRYHSLDEYMLSVSSLMTLSFSSVV